MFSFVPRCHGLRGSQMEICRPVSIVNCAGSAISLPWSPTVNDRTTWSGRRTKHSASAVSPGSEASAVRESHADGDATRA